MLAGMCPTHMHLGRSRRFDAALQEFCERVAAETESVQELATLGRSLFRCPGPWDWTLCLTHAARRQTNVATNRRRLRAAKPASVLSVESKDGPMQLFAGEPVIAAGWSRLISSGARGKQSSRYLVRR